MAEMLGKRSRLLIEVAEQLNLDQWPNGGKLRISDFWLELYRRKHTGPEGKSVTEVIDAAARPKLLIAWLPPIDDDRALSQATPHGKQLVHQGMAWVRDFVRESGHGPVLYLDTPNLDEALAESVAAVRAMQ